MSSVLWGMMRNRKRIGIYLNGNDVVKVKSLENSISGNTQIPYIIVDARETICLLYTSDAADERSSVDLGGRRIIKKKRTVITPCTMISKQNNNTR